MSLLLDSRRAGVLLHISSLPQGGNDFGAQAYKFIDFLHYTGATVWQTLPLGIPHSNDSPYRCISAYAGNSAFIDTQWLVDSGWLRMHPKLDTTDRRCLLEQSFADFKAFASQAAQRSFAQFCTAKAHWLDDFSLFFALRQEFQGRCWSEWPEALKNKNPAAIEQASTRLRGVIEQAKYEQFIFFTQWLELKAYAKFKKVFLFGDIPIFVAYNSADVWANRAVFKLDERGNMSVVAGVPPDYFSANGQLWGNPHYDWDYLKQTQFKWWIDRIKAQHELFDMVRIDHFRGLVAAWEIPAGEQTAVNGQWVAAPGQDLLQEIARECSSLVLVAEDLGIITEEIATLRNSFNLPGMKVLHFAFNGNTNNEYLPHNHTQNSVVYTGTHDNDTTLGWFSSLTVREKRWVYDYLDSATSMPFALINAAFMSVANLAIIPMQDILDLGSKSRMNTPGIDAGNWSWHFEWSQLTTTRMEQVARLIRQSGRGKSVVRNEEGY